MAIKCPKCGHSELRVDVTESHVVTGQAEDGALIYGTKIPASSEVSKPYCASLDCMEEVNLETERRKSHG